ncbi:MAG: tetratricopeptide repeat protein, partial [Maioricimonas sp. JB049]
MHRITLVLLCLSLISVPAALAQDYDLGGARRPNPDMSLKRSGQYKRVHQVTLRYLLRDRADEAREYITRYIDQHPDDAESRFLLGLLDAHAGNPQQAAAAFQNALDNGLPPGRLIAGPRELIEPVREQPLL